MDVRDSEVYMATLDADHRADIKHMAKMLQSNVDNIKLLTDVSVKLQTLIAVHEEKHLHTETKLLAGAGAFSDLRNYINTVDRDARAENKDINKRIDRHEAFINKALGVLLAIDVGLVLFTKFWS